MVMFDNQIWFLDLLFNGSQCFVFDTIDRNKEKRDDRIAFFCLLGMLSKILGSILQGLFFRIADEAMNIVGLLMLKWGSKWLFLNEVLLTMSFKPKYQAKRRCEQWQKHMWDLLIYQNFLGEIRFSFRND